MQATADCSQPTTSNVSSCGGRFDRVKLYRQLGLGRVFSVAKVLEAPDLVRRVRVLLETVESREFLAEEDVATEYSIPTFSEEQIFETVRARARTDKLVEFCLQQQPAIALNMADSADKIDGVCRTLAVLGQFDQAHQARKPNIVLVIELLRRGRFEEAESALAEFESGALSVWDHIHLATALAGRLPWLGYPYADAWSILLGTQHVDGGRQFHFVGELHAPYTKLMFTA